MKKLILSGAMIALSLSNVTFAKNTDVDVITDPYAITVGQPDDSYYANAGDNLRNGVGSLYMRFGESGFICTGAAISKTHVLTAAHCVRDGDNPLDQLLFVLNAGLEAPIIVDAVGFSVHPWYDIFQSFGYGAFSHGDIAVVELAQALPDQIEIYELYTDGDEFNKTARHYGHGTSGTGNKGVTGSADFFYARTGLNTYEAYLESFFGDGIEDQLLMDFDSGVNKHNATQWWFSSEFNTSNSKEGNPASADEKIMVFRDKTIFTDLGFGRDEIGTSPGDSGGPAFIDGKIAGVHSFGFTHNCKSAANGTDFKCGLNSSYGEMSGDTRVSYHANWINDVTSGVTAYYTPVPAPVPVVTATAEELGLEINMESASVKKMLNNTLSANLRQPIK